MGTFIQDVRYGVRMLLNKPGFALIATITLALGIGATTAIFSIVHAVLLRSLPYAAPDRLVVVLHNRGNPVAPADFIAWREQNRVFDHLTAAELWGPNLTGRDRPEQLQGVRATGSLFAMLNVQPLVGRAFQASDDQPGAAPVVVLSHRLWQRRFGGDAGVVGQTLTLNGEGHTVIGVMPAGFEFPLFWATKAELWAPLPLANRADSHAQSLRIFGRLKPGVTGQQAQAEMDGIAARLARDWPDTNTGLSAFATPLHTKIVGDVRLMLLVLLFATGFVLLIACANVANLLLARASSRQKEVAVRLAMGATHWRLARQLLTENLLLAALGGGLGLLLAAWGTGLFAAVLPENILPRQQTIGISGAVLGFTTLVSLLTAIVFGLMPTLQASRTDLNASLKEGGRQSASGASAQGWRNLLVVAEVAMALVLLIGAGLLLKSFAALREVDPGFKPENVLTMRISVAGTKQAAEANRAAFFTEMIERVKALPGVESASTINHLPLAGDTWRRDFHVEGRLAAPAGGRPNALYRVARPDYFGTMGIALLAGRDFTPRDTLQTPNVVVVNETLARRYWPGEEAVGKRFKFWRLESDTPWMTVVGVARDTKQREWIEEASNEVYLAFSQSPNYLRNPGAPFSYQTLVVRTATDPSMLAAAIRNAVWALEPNAPISEVAMMEQVIADETWQPRISMFLIVSFAMIALVLAAVGIYGVLSYAVTERTQEIGIRLALGASGGDVLKLLVGQGMKLAAAGVGIGLMASLALARLLKTLLYGVSATDPLTFAMVALLLAFVALVACWIPARRASKVDPMVALRYE